jgi:hypothetical protein
MTHFSNDVHVWWDIYDKMEGKHIKQERNYGLQLVRTYLPRVMNPTDSFCSPIYPPRSLANPYLSVFTLAD